MKVDVEVWWNYIDKRKSRLAEENLPHCHFVQHISHVDSPGNEPGPPR